jgi:hypothetical protein
MAANRFLADFADVAARGRVLRNELCCPFERFSGCVPVMPKASAMTVASFTRCGAAANRSHNALGLYQPGSERPV